MEKNKQNDMQKEVYYRHEDSAIQKSIYNQRDKYNNSYSTYFYIGKRYKDFCNKYGKCIQTDDKELAIKKDEFNNLYTYDFDKTALEKLSQIFSRVDNINSLENSLICFLDRDHICEYDLIEVCSKHPNIKPDVIGLLVFYVNNISEFNNYLNLFDKCNEQTQELILKIIKPGFIELLNLGYDLDTEYQDSKFYYYLINKDFIVAGRKLCTPLDEFYKRHNKKDNRKFNIAYFEKFNNYFLQFCNAFEEIIKKDNYQDKLKELLLIRQHIFSFETIIPVSRIIQKEQIYKIIDCKSDYDDERNPFDETFGTGRVTETIVITQVPTGEYRIVSDIINFNYEEICFLKKEITTLISLILIDKLNYSGVYNLKRTKTKYYNEYISEITDMIINNNINYEKLDRITHEYTRFENVTSNINKLLEFYNIDYEEIIEKHYFEDNGPVDLITAIERKSKVKKLNK